MLLRLAMIGLFVGYIQTAPASSSDESVEVAVVVVKTNMNISAYDFR